MVFDRNLAANYDKWFDTPFGKHADFLEKKLLHNLVPLSECKTVLDVGCGTGNYLLYFESLGLDPFGIDVSLPMLEIAKKKLGRASKVLWGTAEHLPFCDNSIDLICFITTFEFLEHPTRALQEAARVAKKNIFLGVLNKYSFLAFQRRIKRPYRKSTYNYAKFYTIQDLKTLTKQACPNSKIKWRSVLTLSFNRLWVFPKIDELLAFKKNPFGAFLGIRIDLK